MVLLAMGPAGAIALFGATGAGLTGWKMSKRWGDLEEFAFEPISTGVEKVETAFEVTDEGLQLLDAALASGSGTLDKDIVLPPAQDGRVAVVHRGARQCSREPGAGGVTTIVFERERPRVLRAVHLALFVSGHLREKETVTEPWAEVAAEFFPNSGQFVIRWETEKLRHLGRLLKDMITEAIASNAASFWIKSSVAAVSTAAAAVVVWPIWIVSSMAGLDNLWIVVKERARLAGQCLAHAIADRQVVGQRPVSLVGYSTGARLIFYCLQELYEMGAFHVVHDVVLLGTPVATKKDKWERARAVVSGRLVNGYLPRDWVLGFFFRYLEWGITVAGLSEVVCPGVENYDLTPLGIASHDDYDLHMSNILAFVGAGGWPSHDDRDS